MERPAQERWSLEAADSLHMLAVATESKALLEVGIPHTAAAATQLSVVDSQQSGAHGDCAAAAAERSADCSLEIAHRTVLVASTRPAHSQPGMHRDLWAHWSHLSGLQAVRTLLLRTGWEDIADSGHSFADCTAESAFAAAPATHNPPDCTGIAAAPDMQAAVATAGMRLVMSAPVPRTRTVSDIAAARMRLARLAVAAHIDCSGRSTAVAVAVAGAVEGVGGHIGLGLGCNYTTWCRAR